MNKSSWNELMVAFKSGVHFVHSYRTQHFPTLDALAAHLDTLSTSPQAMPVNRVYSHGSTNIALQKPDGGVSHIDRRGSVYRHGGFYVAVLGDFLTTYYRA